MAIKKLNLKYQFNDKFLNIVLQDYRDKINYILDQVSESSDVDSSLEGYVPITRTISTNTPLSGGGSLSGNLSLSLTGLSWAGTANYLVGVQDVASGGWEYKSLLGTSNQITVTHAAIDAGNVSYGTITLATPQDIATTSNVIFGTIGCGTITVADGSSINLQEDITFTGATTENLIKMPDHLAVALDITEASNSYLKFVTTNSGEKVVFGKLFEAPTACKIGNLTLANGSITDSSNAIDFGNEALSTTGTFGAGNCTVGTIASADITVDSKLVLSAGSITDGDGAISFGNENLSTTGTLGCGALTGSSTARFNGGLLDIYKSGSGTDYLRIDVENSLDGYIKFTAVNASFLYFEGAPTIFASSCLGLSDFVVRGNFYQDQAAALTIQNNQVQDITCWASIASGNPYFYIYGYDTGTSSVQYSRMNVDASGDFGIDIQSGNLLIPNGNVGIATALPKAKLHMTYTTNPASSDLYTIKLQTASDTTVMLLGTDASVGYIQAMDQGVSWSTKPLVLQSRGGKVGIGTTPAETLAVAGNLTLPKTSGNGIKVDNATPTFGWRDLLGDVIAKNTGGTKPTFANYRDTLWDYQFGVNDEEYFKFHIPHDYVAGTDIHLHIHWSHTSAAVDGGTVTFEYEISYAKGHQQAVFPASVGTTFPGTAATGAGGQYKHIITETQISAGTPNGNQIDSDDLEPDGVIIARLVLTSNDMTGATPSPFIHYVDIHYQSTNIGTKNKINDFYA